MKPVQWLLSHDHLLFAVIALVGALALTRGLVEQPGYTDAFYHFNAAEQVARGRGLTDDYLWTYIGADGSLPAPSHLYWMPLTSLTAAAGMMLLNQPGNYAAAQLPLALMFALVAILGYWLGAKVGGTRRHAWLAGLLTLFSGYFTRYWGATDTFAPYALFGALCLVALGQGAVALAGGGRRMAAWFALGGALAGLAHLTRADGVLLLMVGWVVVLAPWRSLNTAPLARRLMAAGVLTLAYGVVMLPWAARNLAVIGSPLPVGGAQGIWFTEYNDLFNYPPDASARALFSDDLPRLLAGRWEAFGTNVGTFVGIEGLIVLAPLMLIGLWARRRDPFLRAFWLYALGLHVVMTLVFPFPGYRGGLLHSSAALVPWWAALGIVGLDTAVDWVARRRRTWHAPTAKRVFSLALLGFAIWLSLTMGLRGRVTASIPALYDQLAAVLPDDARVMVNDPAALYYFTGRGGVPLPNETPDVIPTIASQYDVGYLLLEGRRAMPPSLWSLYDTLPDFLSPIPLDYPDARLYAIDPAAR